MDPLVHPELAEGVLLGRLVASLDRLLPKALDRQERTEGGVGPAPVALVPDVGGNRQVGVSWVNPVQSGQLGVVSRRPADEGEHVRGPGRVLGNALGLVDHPRPPGERVIGLGRDPEEQRLGSGAGTGAKGVPHVTTGLGQELVEDEAVRVGPEFPERVGWDELVVGPGLLVVGPHGVLVVTEPLAQPRLELAHPLDDGSDLVGLLGVGGGAVDLGRLLVVSHQKHQDDPGGKFGFPVLAPDDDIGNPVAPNVAGPLRRPDDLAKEGPNDLIRFPRIENESGPRPSSFGVNQHLGEHAHDPLGPGGAVMGAPLGALQVAEDVAAGPAAAITWSPPVSR